MWITRIHVFVISILCLIMIGCGSMPRNQYAINETNRADGTYGAWVTTEQTDVFLSATFSIATGKALRGADFGESSPKIVIQDDFVVRIYPGDGYICTGLSNGLYVDYVLKGENMPDDSGKRSYWHVSESNDYLKLEGNDASWRKQAWLHALNEYDTAFFKYTDECGEQRVLEFDISGTHHNKTSVVTLNQ